MDTYKRNKNSPNSYLCANAITGYVICCWNIVIDNCMICGLITSCVICCAKCQFHTFLPASSITMPPSCKMLPVAKTPENSTLRAYQIKIGINPIL